MDLQSFYNSTVNQSILYAPSPAREIYRGECVQLACLYIAQVFRLNPPFYMTAADYAEKGIAGMSFIPNNPNDPNQVPPRGAVVCFSRSLPGSGNMGHIDICWSSQAGSSTWVGYDQNWGGRTAHLVTHNFQYVTGWFVPSNAPTPIAQGGDEMIQNTQQAHLAYQLLRPNGDGNDAEIAGTAGKRTWLQFANDAQTEVRIRNQNLAAQATEMETMKAHIDDLNKTITDLKTSTTADEQEKAIELQAATQKISYLTSQLETSHDKITQLTSVNVPQLAGAEAAKPNWLTPFVAAIVKLIPTKKQ